MDDRKLPTLQQQDPQTVSELPTLITEVHEDTVVPKDTKTIQRTKKLLLGVIGAALILLITICVIIGARKPNNGFIQYAHYLYGICQDEQLYILCDDRLIKTKIQADSIRSYEPNLERNVFACITDKDELVVFHGTKAVVAAKNVESFHMSISGNGIVYLTKDSCLYLYKVKTRRSAEITRDFTGSEVQISPDGMSVVYANDKDGQEHDLIYFNGKISTKIGTALELIATSNGGKYIYALGENDNHETILYAYNAKGLKTELGPCNDGIFEFNIDRTQILFVHEGKTFLSTDGKEANKISDFIISTWSPPNAAVFSHGFYSNLDPVCPVKNLYGLFYYTHARSGMNCLWLIQENSDQSKRLVSDVQKFTLDVSGEYLYYINEDNALCVLKIRSKDNTPNNPTVLAQDVDTFVVTSDRSKVYFTSNASLYCCNGKNGSNKTTISSNNVGSRLVISRKDVVFYECNPNLCGYDPRVELYACSNGRTGFKIEIELINSFSATANGYVYIDAKYGKELYASNGSANFKLLSKTE